MPPINDQSGAWTIRSEFPVIRPESVALIALHES